MRQERTQSMDPNDPRIQSALSELQELIRERYPDATFEVSEGEDPEGIYLNATVDVEDTDEVVDVFIERMLELQIEEQLPVYVFPNRPLERVLEELRSRRPMRQPSAFV